VFDHSAWRGENIPHRGINGILKMQRSGRTRIPMKDPRRVCLAIPLPNYPAREA
jgi:hypothetical protein